MDDIKRITTEELLTTAPVGLYELTDGPAGVERFYDIDMDEWREDETITMGRVRNDDGLNIVGATVAKRPDGHMVVMQRVVRSYSEIMRKRSSNGQSL